MLEATTGQADKGVRDASKRAKWYQARALRGSHGCCYVTSGAAACEAGHIPGTYYIKPIR